MTQLLATATQITIDTAFLIDYMFHIPFFDNPDCSIRDLGLSDHWVTFVKLPFLSEKHDDIETIYKFF